jgi:DNA-binding response OmpR family regulator
MNHIKKSVLIVDDEVNIVTAIEYILMDEDVIVFKAFDGEEGLSSAIQNQPDVVILDVMMPGLDGFTVARKIRENEKLSHTKILFLTAKGTPEDKKTGYGSGGELYVVKPFDNDILLEKVLELLSY